jgi:hypothetical protein
MASVRSAELCKPRSRLSAKLLDSLPTRPKLNPSEFEIETVHEGTAVESSKAFILASVRGSASVPTRQTWRR